MGQEDRVPVLGQRISSGGLQAMAGRILDWAARRESRYVCVANVHMVMEASRDSDFARVLKEADLVTPDGMPLVWMLRLSGRKGQPRVAGFDLLRELVTGAAAADLSIFLYGSTEEVLVAVRERMLRQCPGVRVAGFFSPPFRPWVDEEDGEMLEHINASGAHLVFVALGCPKQERWMALHRGRVMAPMVGLGGALPQYAGVISRAPAWMRGVGLEWLYRLLLEPGRLWGRYWSTNVPFLIRAVPEAIGHLAGRTLARKAGSQE